MTMMQKVQAKRSKKGFTLVELVIVIAILAILAAIAIPVITTTINSSKLSVMDSDTASLNMLIKECVNTYKADITTTTYAGATAATATVGNVCDENGIDYSGEYFSRTIGGTLYVMDWVSVGTTGDGDLRVTAETATGTAINDSTPINSLCTR